MKTFNFTKVSRLLILPIAVALLMTANQAIAQTASEPVLLTSCGQSPGPVRLKIFLQKDAIAFDYNLQAKAEDLIN